MAYLFRKYTDYVNLHVVTKSKLPVLDGGTETLISFPNKTSVEILKRDYKVSLVRIDEKEGYVNNKFLVL